MEKLYKTVSAGYEKSGNPAAGAVTAWCYIEESEFEKAENILEISEVQDFCYENNLPLKARFFYKMNDYEKSEAEFEAFYKKLFPDAENDYELYSELRPDELITLVILRKRINKSWKATAKIIPEESLHSDYSWKGFLEKLLAKRNLSILKQVFTEIMKIYTGSRKKRA